MAPDILYSMEREMLRRGLSKQTVRAYSYHVQRFLLFYKDKNPSHFSKADVREYLYFLQEKGLHGSSLNVVHNALRFMMIDILHKGMYLKILFSKVPRKTAEYLTRGEIKSILGSIENEKHHLIIALMYGAGLRVGEVVGLKKEDFDFQNMIGWVRHGKGNKDRPFIIPETLKEKILALCSLPRSFLFMGNNNTHLSIKSVQEIVKKASQKAKISKHIHPHTFRHSFTTHLLESGYDIVTVQSLLGHVHPETTLGYSHAIRPKLITAKSPLDNL